jgi:hypothetical protein
MRMGTFIVALAEYQETKVSPASNDYSQELAT